MCFDCFDRRLLLRRLPAFTYPRPDRVEFPSLDDDRTVASGYACNDIILVHMRWWCRWTTRLARRECFGNMFAVLPRLCRFGSTGKRRENTRVTTTTPSVPNPQDIWHAGTDKKIVPVLVHPFLRRKNPSYFSSWYSCSTWWKFIIIRVNHAVNV